MLAEQTTDPPLDRLRRSRTREDVIMAIEAARAVFVEDSVNRYVVKLLRHTRDSRAAGARGEPARRHRAPAHGEGARGRPRAATTSCPRTCARSPSRCSSTG